MRLFNWIKNLFRSRPAQTNAFVTNDAELTLEAFNEMYSKMKEMAPSERIVIIPAALKFSRWGKDRQRFVDINPNAHWSEFADQIMSMPKPEFSLFKAWPPKVKT